jgi:DNA-binding transcriptional MerR regulator
MENMNVKALVKLIGINENTLRGWERRYNAVTPLRAEDGRRLYSAKDVQRIKYLWELVKLGHAIGQVAMLPTSKLKKMLEGQETFRTADLEVIPSKPSPYLDEMILALEKFDLEKLNAILQKAKFTESPKDIIMKLVQPILLKVGGLVLSGGLSIAQEHLLSALLRDYLGSLFQSLSPYAHSSRFNAKNVLLTTREGDLHEFGILLSAILTTVHSYRTHYLGPNMPVHDLAVACQQFKVDILVLGLMKLPKGREVVSAQEYLQTLDTLLPKKISICIGGSQCVDVSLLKTTRKIVFISDFNELDEYLEKNSN